MNLTLPLYETSSDVQHARTFWKYSNSILSFLKMPWLYESFCQFNSRKGPNVTLSHAENFFVCLDYKNEYWYLNPSNYQSYSHFSTNYLFFHWRSQVILDYMPNKLLQLSKQIYMCVVGNRREAATYQKQFLTFTPWKLKHHTDWTNKRLLYFCTQRQTNKKNWQHNKMLNEKYKRKNLIVWTLKNTHNPMRKHLVYLASLKYKIKMIAITRTATTVPIIHLFLLILLDMAVKTFLLLPTLSSTPWSCSSRTKSSK